MDKLVNLNLVTMTIVNWTAQLLMPIRFRTLAKNDKFQS